MEAKAMVDYIHLIYPNQGCSCPKPLPPKHTFFGKKGSIKVGSLTFQKGDYIPANRYLI